MIGGKKKQWQQLRALLANIGKQEKAWINTFASDRQEEQTSSG